MMTKKKAFYCLGIFLSMAALNAASEGAAGSKPRSPHVHGATPRYEAAGHQRGTSFFSAPLGSPPARAAMSAIPEHLRALLGSTSSPGFIQAQSIAEQQRRALQGVVLVHLRNIQDDYVRIMAEYRELESKRAQRGREVYEASLKEVQENLEYCILRGLAARKVALKRASGVDSSLVNDVQRLIEAIIAAAPQQAQALQTRNEMVTEMDEAGSRLVFQGPEARQRNKEKAESIFYTFEQSIAACRSLKALEDVEKDIKRSFSQKQSFLMVDLWSDRFGNLYENIREQRARLV